MEALVTLTSLAMILFSICCIVWLAKQSVKGIAWIMKYIMNDLDKSL